MSSSLQEGNIHVYKPFNNIAVSMVSHEGNSDILYWRHYQSAIVFPSLFDTSKWNMILMIFFYNKYYLINMLVMF